MVRIQDEDDATRLDRIVREAARAHDLRVDVNGWARRTYDLYTDPGPGKHGTRIARIESYAIRSGEVLVFDDEAIEFAKTVAGELEKAFGIEEAVIKRAGRS